MASASIGSAGASASAGSFHHHFAGAGDFKQALLAAYEALVVDALNQAIEQTAADSPKAALAGLTAAITSTESFYRPDLEVAMRACAFSEPEFAQSKSGFTGSGLNRCSAFPALPAVGTDRTLAPR